MLGNNLFTYCGNNPVSYDDPTGYACAPSIGIGFHSCLSLDSGSATYESAPEYISSQNNPAIAHLSLGLATVSHGGCGVVATYNALITLGEGIPFSQVLAHYNNNPGVLACGFLGMLPDAVAKFFTSRGYNVTMTDDPNLINAFSQKADASILWYTFPESYAGVNLFGAHFVEYHKAGSTYIGYNTKESNGAHRFYNPVEYGYRNDRYYVIGIFIYK